MNLAKLILSIIFLVSIQSSKSFAIAKKSEESILDRLERRLLEQERESLSFGSSLESKSSGKANTIYSFESKHIDEVTPSNQDIEKLGLAVAELEAQAEYLSNGVQRVKQKILQDAAIDNLVNISARLANGDEIAFRSLNVKVDGHSIYEQNAALGLWIPHNTVLLYRGPMQPGNHRVDFEAKVIKKAKQSIPIQNDSYHIISETYNFLIPSGKAMRKWEIVLSGGSDAGAMALAEFKELP